MIIIGVDYHPSFQQISFVDESLTEGNKQSIARVHQEKKEDFCTPLTENSRCA